MMEKSFTKKKTARCETGGGVFARNTGAEPFLYDLLRSLLHSASSGVTTAE